MTGSPMRVEELARSVAGRLRGAGCGVVAGAGIDTRTLEAGQAFFAIRGERADGHDFLPQAAAAGAAVAVVEREVDAPRRLAVVRVDSVARALARAAAAWRDRLGCQRVGVMGSNGKTTAARMLASVLGGCGSTHAPRASFNNALGLPLTILNAPAGTRWLVCELGEGEPGALARYVRLARPHAVLLTSVGAAHAGTLGGLAGVRDEFARALGEAADARAVAIPASACELAAGGLLPGALTFGEEEGATLRVARAWHEGGGVRFELHDASAWALPTPGRHNAHNAAGVIALCRSLGVGDGDIRAGLGSFAPASMRLGVRQVGAAEVLVDCYNANPDSVEAALATLAELGAGRRRVAILGDMLELGELGERAHARAGRRAAGVADECVFIGRASLAGHRAALEAGASSAWHADAGGALPRARALALERSVVLVKGSRALTLERVVGAMASAASAAVA